MNDTLDLPPIESPALPVATQPAAPEPGTLKATALASFVAIRSHAAKLAEKYRAVAYDVTTPKALAADPAAPLHAREAAAAIVSAAVEAAAPQYFRGASELAEMRAALAAPTLTLGKFNEFIAPLKIDAAGLEALGFTAVKVHNAKLYHEGDRPAMVAAMVKHLQAL